MQGGRSQEHPEARSHYRRSRIEHTDRKRPESRSPTPTPTGAKLAALRTFETEPLHFQLPPTKNLRPDMRDALEVNPRAAWAGALATADAAAANMI